MIYRVKSDYAGNNQLVEAGSIADAYLKAKNANLAKFTKEYEDAPYVDPDTHEEVSLKDAIPDNDIEPYAVELLAGEIVR